VAVDVTTEVVIDRPVAVVELFATHPTHVPRWYANIDRAEWVTPPPLGVGTRLAFEASFLGRRLVYTYEVVEHVRGRRFVMRTEQGPFPMETTYTWEPTADGGTRMTLRNRGEPSSFSRIAGALMGPAVRRANRKDLAALKRLAEVSARAAR
jgi:uncharacterized protein YndB with AHSA1/START domain